MSRSMLLFVLAAACQPPTEDTPDPTGDDGVLAAAGTTVSFDAGTGRLSIVNGQRELVGASASAWVDGLGDAGRRVAIEQGGDVTFAESDVDTPLGTAPGLTVQRPGADAEPTLVWEVALHDEGFVTLRVTARNDTSADLELFKTSALEVRQGEGGLFLSEHPRTLRILDNGSFTFLDFVANVHAGDAPRSGWDAIVPGEFLGHVASNWNHAIQDVAGDGAWVAGGITFDTAITVLNTSYEPFMSTLVDGREGFTRYSAENAYLPNAKVLQPGEALSSEWLYVHPGEPGAKGVEHWAQAAADANAIVPWHKRGGGKKVPNGWNSWSTSGSTGGYGTDIDQDIILDNLDVMATELRDWGMDWFQIDDGYEPTYGEWTWRADRFPEGPKWLSDQIRDRGLRPGLWQATLTAYDDAPMWTDKPEWFASYGSLSAVLGGGYRILDITHPEVLQWLEERATELRYDWGFDWLKLDFGYYAMFGEDRYDPTLTREEAWRNAMQVIRDALGPDAFFLTIGAMGVNFGIADGNRLTLDTMPVWDRQPQDAEDDPLGQQGLKPTVRVAGRRWYMHGRTWVNHPDLLVFRSNTRDPEWPRVTFEEARAYASWIGLTGGIVKLGDRLVDLTGDEINVIRTLLPTYGEAATPLDVFTRDIPETWHVSVQPKDGFEQDYDVVGLFHWGRNVDLSVNPFEVIADTDAPRSVDLDLAELGIDEPREAYEFWTGEFLGIVDGRLQIDVPSHDARVVALRPVSDAPHFLGWNRQLSMGGTLLGAVDWDEGEGTLSLQLHAAAPLASTPFTYEIALWVPDDLDVQGVSYDAEVSGEEVERDGEVVRLRFVPGATGELGVTVELVPAG